MVETRRLIELRSRLIELLEVPAGDLVVALSGGADSAALAYLLGHPARRFRAVHVNHGLPDSSKLERAARGIAGRLGVDLDVAAVAVPAGASAEGQARHARYESLSGQLETGEWLLTAHTREDQAETVLMNLLRGSGPAGLAGIPVKSGSIARPMLGISRSETRELAVLADLPFYDDPANLDPANRRNVIRLEVLPGLEARFNPRLVESLARAATLTRSDEDYLQGQVGSVSLLARGSSVAVPVGGLAAVPRPVADRAVRGCLARVRPPHSGTAAEMAQIWAVASGERRSTLLAGGIEVAVDGPLLVFSREPSSHASSSPVALEVGVNTVDGYEIEIERVDRVCRVAPVGPGWAVFDPEARLTARVDEKGRLVVEADGSTAWLPGERRLGVAWYQPRTTGYLSVFAREECGWTSSP